MRSFLNRNLPLSTPGVCNVLQTPSELLYIPPRDELRPLRLLGGDTTLWSPAAQRSRHLLRLAISISHQPKQFSSLLNTYRSPGSLSPISALVLLDRVRGGSSGKPISPRPDHCLLHICLCSASTATSELEPPCTFYLCVFLFTFPSLHWKVVEGTGALSNNFGWRCNHYLNFWLLQVGSALLPPPDRPGLEPSSSWKLESCFK